MSSNTSISPKNFSLTGFIKLTRVWNLLIIVLAQYFTAIFLVAEGDNWNNVLFDLRLFLLSLSTVLIAASGYIINDYYDVKIDYINKPERVVVGKVLKRRVVMVAHTFINFAGIAIGAYLSLKLGLINFLSALLLWLYSNILKRRPFIGNFSVALLTGLSIYVVNVLYEINSPLVIIYALFAFSFTLIREVIKDMEDIRGDLAFGCKTLPIIWGIRRTKWFLFYISLAFLFCVIVISNLFLTKSFILLSFLLIPPVAVLIFYMYRADTKRAFTRLSNLCKLIMLLGIISMIII
ncbi:MAG: geranylgeranylglycerol-phosphate geranylgeranyltransferase [Bacteroidota bacterium]